eukprot:scaffold13985_cov86-Skeletonema_dohrnii-CCMP3373.AAC.2
MSVEGQQDSRRARSIQLFLRHFMDHPHNAGGKRRWKPLENRSSPGPSPPSSSFIKELAHASPYKTALLFLHQRISPRLDGGFRQDDMREREKELDEPTIFYTDSYVIGT